jgi:hypothetical protein
MITPRGTLGVTSLPALSHTLTPMMSFLLLLLHIDLDDTVVVSPESY